MLKLTRTQGYKFYSLNRIVFDAKDNEAQIRINSEIFQRGFEAREFPQKRHKFQNRSIKEAASENISWKPLKWDSNAVVFSPAIRNQNMRVSGDFGKFHRWKGLFSKVERKVRLIFTTAGSLIVKGI